MLLFNKDQTPLVTLGLGLALVLGAGWAFRHLTDGGFHKPAETATPDAVLRAGDAERELYRERLARATAVLDERLGAIDEMEKLHRAAVAEAEESETSAADLEKLHRELAGEVDRLAADFDAYRAAYRKRASDAAAGEKLERLELPDGRTYENVTISRITEVGAEILHSTGSARIAAGDLPRAWESRFLWADERARDERRAAERRRRELMDAARVAEARALAQARSTASPEEIDAARMEVKRWAARVAELRGQSGDAEARVDAAAGKLGVIDLEITTAKANRLSGQLSRANARYLTARSWLTRIAPGDPLLEQLPLAESGSESAEASPER